MDEPITDVVFVTDEKDTPKGYKVLTECPDQHSANLWQKFLGAKTEIRYICYTKEDKDGTVVEDMYIPSKNERYIMKGYAVVKRTVTGEDSLNLKYLAIKKTARHKAKKAVMDIAVFRSKDKPAAIYKKLGAKLNGLYICVRLDDLKSKATSTAGAPPPISSTAPSSSSSPLQTAPSNYSSQPSPLPSNPPQTSPLPSSPPRTSPLPSTPFQSSPIPSAPSQSSPLPSTPPQTETQSSPPPYARSALTSEVPPPVASAPDSSTYPVEFGAIQTTPPPPSTYNSAQSTSSSGAFPVTDVPANVTPPAPYATPHDTGSYNSAPVGSRNDDHVDSEIHTVALGFELLDLDQPIPESFQQLDDSPPDSDDDISPSEFYKDELTPSAPPQLSTDYSQAPAMARSRTIGHGSGPATVPNMQKRSGSMYSSSSRPEAGQGYPPPVGSQGYPPHPASQGYPPQPVSQGYPSQGYPPQGYPPQPRSQGYPPQSGSQAYPSQAAGSGYPPQVSGPGYPPRPGNQGYPPPAGGQGYPPPARAQGYPPPVGGSGYPPPAGYPSPAGFTGYNAGPGFGAAPAPSGPRPYNPYEHGRSAHGSQPGYPPAYPPSNTSYGFKI